MAKILTTKILEHMVTAVLLLDKQCRVIYLNPAAEELLDISARRVLGLLFQELLFESELSEKAVGLALETGQSFTQRDLQLHLHDGRLMRADVDVSPTGDFECDGLLVEVREVEQHKRRHQETTLLFQHQTARDMVRSMAHEIKNPLGGLKGAAQLLERSLPDESLKDYTQIILGEVDRLSNLVDRMLGPHTLPKFSDRNIHELLERVKQLVEIELPPTIQIERDYDPSIPELLGDRDMLIQACLNIVRNAAQALQENKVDPGRIILRTRTKRQISLAGVHHRLALLIQIIDNGPGVPDELVDKLFYPMVTGRSEGTGLGLSIAQSLINQHQGLIDCESQAGQTVFNIYLPLEQNF